MSTDSNLNSTTQTIDGLPLEARARHELLVLHCPDQRWVGRCIPLDGRNIVFGRHPDAEYGLRVRDPCMSRNHCALAPQEGSAYYVIEDAGSKNHTYVDGCLIAKRHLAPNSVIRAGHTVMLHRHVPAHARRGRTDSRSHISGDPLARIVGASYATQALRGSIVRVARAGLTVLVEGETGTGKELVARTVHALSSRPGAFHPVNCSAIPTDVAESELFGTKPGAYGFEGSAGHFGAAHEGTLFLDEIAELPMELQPKFLRVLESSIMHAVGDPAGTAFDVRFIASTNADLEEATEQKLFRADLFARLQEWPIHIPPLRDRPDDVIALTYHFLTQQRSGLRLTADVAEALLLYAWPYNVRELQKLVRRLCLLCDEETIPLRVLPDKIQQPLHDRQPSSPTANDSRPSEEELRAALESFGGSVSLTARHFGKNRRQVYRWLAQCGVDHTVYRQKARPRET